MLAEAFTRISPPAAKPAKRDEPGCTIAANGDASIEYVCYAGVL
jgi:hypothetical protein